MLREEKDELYTGDHIQVRFRGVGGRGADEARQDGASGGTQGGKGGTGQTVERMMEIMRLQGEQLQLLAASMSGVGKEVEELKSGKGKQKQRKEKEVAIPPLSAANVEKMEGAPHLPWSMSGQCKLLKELLGGLGEEWVAEDMEGVKGGDGGGAVDSNIVQTGPEDGGTPWDKFAWGIWVGMVPNKREYGTKWAGSKKGANGPQTENKGGGEGGRGGCHHATGIL